MRRRSLLALGAAPAALPAAFSAQQPARSDKLKIAALEFWRLEGRRDTIAGVNGQHQVQPLHIYDEHRPKPYRDTEPKPTSVNASALYLKIRTDAGLDGLYGPIDREAAIVVDQQLKRLLIGKDALAVETLWDQMHRGNRHSRRGHFMMAISAVDNALWDLRGRYYNAPVYRLLGGPTRPAIEAYGSCLGYSVEPPAAAAKAAALKKEGYRHQKWFLAYGPGDGLAGLKKNVDLVRALRESVGDDVELMFDAFSGWQLDYAISWAKQVEPFRPRWIEEAFPPDRIDAFAALRRATSVPVASGEHFYGRWETNDYLKAGAISVVQADPEWCGGTSELAKICAVASLYDAQVVPHGHNLHAALHVVAAQSPGLCPLVEYLISKMSSYYHFDKHSLTPVNGKITLPDRPGFGMELDDAKILKRSLVTSW